MEQIRGIHNQWRISPFEAEAQRLADALRAHRLVGQVLWLRGVREADAGQRFMRPKMKDLYDPSRLPGTDKAAQRIVEAVREGERIVIYGDYDVDGITATSILFHILKALCPDADVGRYVPHRIDEGYGINTEALDKLIDKGAQLIVSVDCGIGAHEPAKHAKQRGADLIITDHHELGAELPEAYAVVHPGLEADGLAYPNPQLCGAGVAYKLAWQIARVWCGSDRVSEALRKVLVDLLSFAALGTIADVVPLIDENRTIAHYGLGQIKDTAFVGLNTLIDTAKLREAKIDAYHAGFVLGPRLNACGRMGHAKRAVHLFTDASLDEAKAIAAFLDGENEKRRAIERQITTEACRMVEAAGYDRDEVRVIVLGHEGWHPGVIGIVCSRLVDQYGRPTVLLNTANGQAQGSARSIEGFNINEAFTACTEHLDKFGGHAMAAGLRLAAENIDAFRRDLTAYASEHLSVDDLVPTLAIDAEVTLDELNVGVVEELNQLAPFGRANPRPLLLLRGVTVKQQAKAIGRQGNHLSMIVTQGRITSRCIAWRMGDLASKLGAGTTLDLAARPTLNHWQGRTTMELEVTDLRLV